jgi:hypothetical protein
MEALVKAMIIVLYKEARCERFKFFKKFETNKVNSKTGGKKREVVFRSSLCNNTPFQAVHLFCSTPLLPYTFFAVLHFLPYTFLPYSSFAVDLLCSTIKNKVI